MADYFPLRVLSYGPKPQNLKNMFSGGLKNLSQASFVACWAAVWIKATAPQGSAAYCFVLVENQYIAMVLLLRRPAFLIAVGGGGSPAN